VRTVTRAVAPFILLYGLYLVVYGHHSPGGGFPAGVVIAGGLILTSLALGRAEARKALPRSVAVVLMCVGALGFLAMAVCGVFMDGGGFFWNFLRAGGGAHHHELLGAGNIQVYELMVTLVVACGFAAVFVVLAGCRLGPDGGFDSDEEE
jgi:multicomponent Na+:H+ antiporter subunit B